ncbi:histidine kinase dimerization/phosphoacceptor domain -containing protein [Pararhodobacter oceanensis]|nr:histidine kinase dimerization/phosphoacceptor domain -containing protein [Pararhodobacter oceanensis]
MKRIVTGAKAGLDRLSFRLAIVFAIALLPLMIVSIVRSQSVLNEAAARSRAALVGETLRAVQHEIIVIEGAKAVAQTLSRSIPVVLGDLELCNQLLRDKIQDTVFSFAGYYDTEGNVPCSSTGEAFSFGLTDELIALNSNPRPDLVVNQTAPASGASVIHASYPVFDDFGELQGYAAVSVPHHRLEQSDQSTGDASMLTLSPTGTVLTAPGDLEEARRLLPSNLTPDSFSDQTLSFADVDRDGIERLYALVPVVEGELYALSTWTLDSELRGGFYLQAPALFPVLMWLASLAVAWFAATLFVTRHVVRLRTAMNLFAASRRTTMGSEFKSAPRELRDVADTFIGMTDTILRDEAKIEDSLRQKDILLREVHHRVKNNLQLIASIMSMQMRQSRSKEVRQLMQGLHDRVTSLATIHRNLYQTSGQADISMNEHLETIVHQVVKMAALRNTSIEVDTEFAEVRLNPDQAVPLSLFVTEAMTNALKYIGNAKGHAPSLRVAMELGDDAQAEVVIENSLPPRDAEPDDEKSSGLGTELMEAFAAQLSGDFSATQEGGVYRVSLSFPVDDLDPKG